MLPDRGGSETDYAEFAEALRHDAEASGESLFSSFFARYASIAAENGDCPDLQQASIQRDGRGGYQLDGYAFDAERGVLFAAVCDFREADAIATLNAAQIEALIGRAKRFIEKMLDPAFCDGIAEGTPEFDCAQSFCSQPALLRRVQILLFSNARLSTRRPPELAGDVAGRPVVCNVLDFARYQAIQRSRGAPEPVEIDIEALAGAPLPCLQASTGAANYDSYLIAIPGELLASIYELYGPRLLEQNVRTFLQARTKVNKGIIATIRENPEMFFAYNNGLTATASAVRLASLPNGLSAIRLIEDLQIVNGAQTTASLLYARDQARAGHANVYVQMKLSVVRPDRVEDVVPRISRYANTQNKVSEADFFSGHPFHLTIEQLSRRLMAPPAAGAVSGSKWFYERARGQYKDASAYGTPTDRKRFEAQFPKSQLIDKTELAKYELTFSPKPHIVCLGAQKCFLSFAETVAREWEAAPLSFNEAWFRAAAARALIFRWTDQMIGRSEWYRADRAYKSQTIAYTLGWLANRVKQGDKAGINYSLIWSLQSVPEEMRTTISAPAPKIAAAIRTPSGSIRNVGEFCKQQACWNLISRMEFDIPELPDSLLQDQDDATQENRDAAAVRRTDVDIDLDHLMVALNSRADEVVAFCRKNGLLSPKSDSALRKMARGQFVLPQSERNALKHLFSRMDSLGFTLPKPRTEPVVAQPSDARHIELSGTAIRRVRI